MQRNADRSWTDWRKWEHRDREVRRPPVTSLRLAALAASIVIVSSACASAAIVDADLAVAAVPRVQADPAGAARAAEALDALGFDLYRKLATGDGNVVFSPASIALALAMARAGASGATADQMDTLMRSMASDENAAWVNALDAALAARTGSFKDVAGHDQPVTLRIANAPFGQRDMPLVPGYLDALASRFGAGLRLVDYRKDPEGARLAIDAWVSDQTEDRIPELLAKGDVDGMTRLVLVNAIYLKSAWQFPFWAGIAAAPFTKLDGSTIQVPTMTTSDTFGHAVGAGWQAVELPYVGGSLAMTIVMPDDLAAFEAGLNTDVLGQITSGLTVQSVELTLPKFGIETHAGLGDALAGLGMTDAFDSNRADFSGITRAEKLHISEVVHQANIDVDEKGTTAAAATGVVLRAVGRSLDVVTLHVDRPFVFLVRDVPTGAILFMGRVTDPANR